MVWYTPGLVAKTSADGSFRYEFPLCDDPKYGSNDHTSYPIAYFHGGKISESKKPGPYVKNEYSTGPAFTLKVCPADIHATVSRTNVDFTNMTYHLDSGAWNHRAPQNAFNGDSVDWYAGAMSDMHGTFHVKGYVRYDVLLKDKRPVGTVTFNFSNPPAACSILAASSHPELGTMAHACGISSASPTGAYADYCVWINSPRPTICKATGDAGNSHTVLEKKPNSYVHAPHSGKTVLPHHLTVNKM
jgi:hypothetical protein